MARLSKISEISIRKYESGERNPKENQIVQIATALGVNPKMLHDFADIENYGDAMTLFFILENELGIDYSFEKDPQGRIKSDSVKFCFTDKKLNEMILSWIEAKEKFSKIVQDSNLLYPDLTEEEITKKYIDNSEIQKQILTLNADKITQSDI